MHHPFGALDTTSDQQQPRAHRHRPIGLKQFGPDHDIDRAGLILQRHETDPLGRAGPLPHQHHPRRYGAGPIGCHGQLRGGLNP